MLYLLVKWYLLVGGIVSFLLAVHLFMYVSCPIYVISNEKFNNNFNVILEWEGRIFYKQ